MTFVRPDNPMRNHYRFKKLHRWVVGGFALFVLTSCMPSGPTAPVNITLFPTMDIAGTAINPTLSPVVASFSANPTETPTPTTTSTSTLTPTIIVESLKAIVTAEKYLSCNYGPGSEYLYLYGLRNGANIKLIGRTQGNHWVYVDGKNKCWVNAEYINIAGDMNKLPVVYPGIAKLPVSPYYQPTTVLKVSRDKNIVTVKWLDIPLRAGDEEDASMQHYIIELWRCNQGNIIFDPLATNDLLITFSDEPGCSEPSHGRIFVQEKHGFAGPAEIPWPAYQ
jgi:uncharacterized protein YraI